MIARTFAERGPDVALFRARRELFAREPQLGAVQFARMSEEREAFIGIVKRRIAASDPGLPTPRSPRRRCSSSASRWARST